MSENEYLTVDQAAERANRHAQTIRNWVRSGKLPAFRLGQSYLIRPEDLDAMYQPVQVKPVTTVEPEVAP
jgi:excisionase family DNA binding protein